MLPGIVGSSMAQINLLLDTIIASFLVTGSVTWLYYSDRLVEFPLGVFGIALSTVILPHLSRHHAEASPEDFSRTLDWALRLALLIGLPATVGLMLLSGPLLTTLFQYGAFDAHDARMSTLSLITFSFGLIAFMLIKVLAPGFYARQDTRTPVRIGMISLGANMGFNLLIVVPLAWYGVQGLHAGLAFATSLAAYLNAGQLFWRLRKEGAWRAESGWGLFWTRMLVANGAMALFLLLLTGPLDLWLQLHAGERALRLGLLTVGGAVVYLAALGFMGVRPRDLRHNAVTKASSPL
jgi:putative peptidoglycan lipid II flippase